jgi:hypothetical protein
MSYIGRGVDAISNVEKLDNITFDGSTTYALTKSSVAFTPSGANNILISIDGVVQMGNFSVSTTNIVLDWSPTSANTCNWILHFGTGVLNVPADGSIVAAKMAANSVDSASYVDLSIDTAHIGATQVTGAKLNTDVISAQTALAVAPADTDEFMVSDAGVLKRIDYSLIKAANTPAFMVVMGSDDTVADSTFTKATFDTEVFDTDSAFASDKFTVPSGGDGKYVLFGHIYFYSITDGNRVEARIYKNGSNAGSSSTGESTLRWYASGTGGQTMDAGWTWVGNLVATDYIELYVMQTNGNSQTLYRSSWMCGYKLIGV